MKITTLVLALLLLSLTSFSQVAQDKSFYEQKVIRYTKMKKTGTTLSVLGGVLTVVGIAVLANSSIETTDDGYGNVETTTTGNPGLGVLALTGGMAGLGAGIPLAIIGSKKKKLYEDKAKSLSFRFNVKPSNTGLVLTYKF